jgi:hypothetical protein
MNYLIYNQSLRIWVMRLVCAFSLLVMGIPFSLFFDFQKASGNSGEQAQQQASIIVLVNSESPSFPDFAHWIQPYLENFGIPYRVVNLAKEKLPDDPGQYSAILIGHARIDVDGKYLGKTDQRKLVQAVANGTGLINFDNDLSSKNAIPRYPFVQALFGFQYTSLKTGYGLRFLNPVMHYITSRHTANEELLTSPMTTAGIRTPVTGTVLALMADGQPFLTVSQVGAGRAVQWASYDWISDPSRGPVSGMDDLVWRSIVWVARKPFVMQAMPPFVTMRVDDVSGPLWWAHTASEAYPFKPWIGVFINDFSRDESEDLSQLVRDGKATALFHAFNMENFVYADHLARGRNGANLPDAVLDRNFRLGVTWQETYHVPLSKFAVGHYYELSENAYAIFDTLGISYIGTLMDPGKQYGAPWVQEGPYRLFTSGSSKSTRPFYYADYVQIPDHPELSSKLFNCMTEIRDDAGYEWFPGSDIQGSIKRGIRQTERALNSLVLATLFTHEYHIKDAGPQKWNAILKGVTDDLANEHPMYVTLDQACQYARAIHDTRITASRYDPASHRLSISLEGHSDMPTMLYLFTGQADQIQQQFLDVPVIAGTLTLTDNLP